MNLNRLVAFHTARIRSGQDLVLASTSNELQYRKEKNHRGYGNANPDALVRAFQVSPIWTDHDLRHSGGHWQTLLAKAHPIDTDREGPEQYRLG